MSYLDPKNDITFKKVFGEHPHILKSFLNSVMPFEAGQEIVDLNYLPLELYPDIPELKLSIVDVRCTDQYGRQFIIEIQLIFTESFFSRVLFNAAKTFTQQLIRGNEYYRLTPVYSVNIIDANMGFEGEDFFHYYKIMDVQHSDRKLKGIEFLFIEVPKFKADSILGKRAMIIWMKYFSGIKNKMEMIPQEMMDEFKEVPEVAEAVSLLETSSYTREELEQYDRYWDVIRTKASMLHDARMEGEQRKNREVILKGYEKGVSVEVLSVQTNLSEERVQEIIDTYLNERNGKDTKGN